MDIYICSVPVYLIPSLALVQNADVFGYEICFLSFGTSCKLGCIQNHEALQVSSSHLHL